MKYEIERLKGVFAATFTPYDHSGKVTTAPLKKYMQYLFENGIDGVFIGGSNGECFLQSLEERMRMADAMCAEIAGERPVIMHIGSINPQDAYALAAKAKELKVTAISSVVPFYYGYTIKEISAYYRKLIDIAELPMIAYYVPENTGSQISAKDFIENIINIPGLAGLKYTHPDLFLLDTLANGRKDGKLLTYGGLDQMGIAFLSMGADGLIGATFNLVPEVYSCLYKAFAEGNIAKAMSLQKLVNKFSMEIKKYSRSAYKALLSIRGIKTGVARTCWTEISEDDILVLRKVLENTLKEFETLK